MGYSCGVKNEFPVFSTLTPDPGSPSPRGAKGSGGARSYVILLPGSSVPHSSAICLRTRRLMRSAMRRSVEGGVTRMLTTAGSLLAVGVGLPSDCRPRPFRSRPFSASRMWMYVPWEPPWG